ncbi:MAG: TetR family transcriptional regulator, partial [Rhodococcus sp. (in: high G+C Gram-positive bacteria)]|nr:TetR family transcriptional regulator [Rhodococcus sp. (in: high G+C Gram-positive bacteria)]
MTEHNGTYVVADRKPLQPRAERTRGKLLAAAAARFDAEGYTFTNVNTVIADAETTKGGMYFHFASKESMAQNLIEE